MIQMLRVSFFSIFFEKKTLIHQNSCQVTLYSSDVHRFFFANTVMTPLMLRLSCYRRFLLPANIISFFFLSD